nr:hypothetical protein [Tanacetum cinerariifolium]
FGLAKLMTFFVMCKAYGGEPSVELLWDFLNLGPADPIMYLVGLKTSWVYNSKEPIIYYHGNEMDFRSFMGKELIAIFIIFLERISKIRDKILPLEAPQKIHKVLPQASKAAGKPSDPLYVDSDPDIHEFPLAKELRDSANCHWVVAHVTPCRNQNVTSLP